MMQSKILDTSFRSALSRMAKNKRLLAYDKPVDQHLEATAILKKFDGREAILFSAVKNNTTPVIGNLLSSKENCEAAFGLDFNGIRSLIQRAMNAPIEPVLMDKAPAQEVVLKSGFDIGSLLPAAFHAPGDAGRYITAGIVVVKDPVTGVYNASYHRLQIIGLDRVAIKLDLGRHLRAAFERAQQKGEDLPVAVCIGTDIALHFTAATMGSQMPESADELAVAGGLAGKALPVVKGVSQDLLIPAETEFVLEGKILANEAVPEGPFGEFIGFAAPAADAPVLQITAVTHRKKPIYHIINGFGRETIMLRKYVLEASLLKVLQSAIPNVVDVEMTVGGLHRFHVVIQVKKTSRQHNGLQRNAMLAAFGALKDLDLVTVVDDDIDIRDVHDVEYAVATRMEASSDLVIIPAARGHEYVRVSNEGVRAKLGIDATVPFEDQAKFRRVEFAPTEVKEAAFNADPAAVLKVLNLS